MLAVTLSAGDKTKVLFGKLKGEYNVRKMKFKCECYIKTHFGCKLCGKEFEGEQQKQEHKFQRHLILRHPIYFWENYCKLKKNIREKKRSNNKGEQ